MNQIGCNYCGALNVIDSKKCYVCGEKFGEKMKFCTKCWKDWNENVFDKCPTCNGLTPSGEVKKDAVKRYKASITKEMIAHASPELLKKMGWEAPIVSEKPKLGKLRPLPKKGFAEITTT